MVPMTRFTITIALSALLVPIYGAPTSFQVQNGLDAQKLNAQFATLSPSDTCTDGQEACVNNAFAQCIQGAWELTLCNTGEICVALPLVAKPGTSIACDSEGDAIARMQAAGVDASLAGSTASDNAGPTGSSLVNATVSPTPTPTEDPEGDCEDDGDGDEGSSVVSTPSSTPTPSLILLNKRERPGIPRAPSVFVTPTPDLRAMELVKRQTFPTFPISSTPSGSATPVVSALAATPTPSSPVSVEVVTVTVFSVVVVTATPTPSLASGLASSASIDSSSVVSAPDPTDLPPLFSSSSVPGSTPLASSVASAATPTGALSIITLTPRPASTRSPIVTNLFSTPSPAPSVSNVVGAVASSSPVFLSATTINLNSPSSSVASNTGFPVSSSPTPVLSSSISSLSPSPSTL